MKTIFISYNHSDEKSQCLVDFIRTNLGDTEISTICSNDCEFCYTEDKSIIDKINKCSLFICFLDYKNKNALFELGYALGRNKKIITIGEVGNIPFDVQNMGYLKPETSPFDLLTKVEKQLQLVEEPPLTIDLLSKNPNEAIDSLISMPELLDNLDGREFETLVANWFRHKGYVVEQSAKDNDSGYDFIVYPFRGGKAIVEVKKYKSTSRVPLSIVRQLVGSMSLERIQNGIIVSSATFPNSAKYFVKDIETNVFLWTVNDLVIMRDMSKITLEQTVEHELF